MYRKNNSTKQNRIINIFTEVFALSVILFSMNFLQEKPNEMPRYFQAANKNSTKILIGFLYTYISLLFLHRYGTTFSYCHCKHKENHHFLSNTNAKRQRKPIRNETHKNNTFIRCEYRWSAEQQRNTNTLASVSRVEKVGESNKQQTQSISQDILPCIAIKRKNERAYGALENFVYCMRIYIRILLKPISIDLDIVCVCLKERCVLCVCVFLLLL